MAPIIPPTAHPGTGAPEPTPDEAAFLAELTGPAPDPFTPSVDEVQKAKADILAHVIPGRLGLADVAHALLAERAVMLADDVVYGQDPAPAVRRIRALEAARVAVARVGVAR